MCTRFGFQPASFSFRSNSLSLSRSKCTAYTLCDRLTNLDCSPLNFLGRYLIEPTRLIFFLIFPGQRCYFVVLSFCRFRQVRNHAPPSSSL